MTCKEQAPSNIQTRALWKTWKLIATEGTSDPKVEKSKKKCMHDIRWNIFPKFLAHIHKLWIVGIFKNLSCIFIVLMAWVWHIQNNRKNWKK